VLYLKRLKTKFLQCTALNTSCFTKKYVLYIYDLKCEQELE